MGHLYRRHTIILLALVAALGAGSAPAQVLVQAGGIKRTDPPPEPPEPSPEECMQKEDQIRQEYYDLVTTLRESRQLEAEGLEYNEQLEPSGRSTAQLESLIADLEEQWEALRRDCPYDPGPLEHGLPDPSHWPCAGPWTTALGPWGWVMDSLEKGLVMSSSMTGLALLDAVSRPIVWVMSEATDGGKTHRKWARDIDDTYRDLASMCEPH